MLVWRYCGKTSDDTWVKAGKRQQCYKPNKVAFIYCDAVPKPKDNYPASHSIEPFGEMKWNKNCNGSWRRKLSSVVMGFDCLDCNICLWSNKGPFLLLTNSSY